MIFFRLVAKVRVFVMFDNHFVHYFCVCISELMYALLLVLQDVEHDAAPDRNQLADGFAGENAVTVNPVKSLRNE
ncbi:MAG: hypothetical protein IKX56_03705 [Muribaculaceae bacterium]|nr:hypothetical protein [Muribaculaceae bacterium]